MHLEAFKAGLIHALALGEWKLSPLDGCSSCLAGCGSEGKVNRDPSDLSHPWTGEGWRVQEPAEDAANQAPAELLQLRRYAENRHSCAYLYRQKTIIDPTTGLAPRPMSHRMLPTRKSIKEQTNQIQTVQRSSLHWSEHPQGSPRAGSEVLEVALREPETGREAFSSTLIVIPQVEEKIAQISVEQICASSVCGFSRCQTSC